MQKGSCLYNVNCTVTVGLTFRLFSSSSSTLCAAYHNHNSLRNSAFFFAQRSNPQVSGRVVLFISFNKIMVDIFVNSSMSFFEKNKLALIFFNICNNAIYPYQENVILPLKNTLYLRSLGP